jgi:predicted Na+-dependent transporter
LPLWAVLFAKITADFHDTSFLPGAAVNHVQLPLVEMFVIVGIQLLAIGLGLFASRRCSRNNFRLWKRYVTPLSIAALLLWAVVDLMVSWSTVCLISGRTLLLCVGLTVVGYLSGFVVAYLSGRTCNHVVVVGLETGARTTFVVSALLRATMHRPEADEAFAASVVSASTSILPAVAVCLTFRLARRWRANVRYAEAACKLLPVVDRHADDTEELCLRPQLISS